MLHIIKSSKPLILLSVAKLLTAEFQGDLVY